MLAEWGLDEDLESGGAARQLAKGEQCECPRQVTGCLPEAEMRAGRWV